MPILNRRYQPKTQGRNNRAFYQSARWHRLSLQYRKKHPLCVHCKQEGKLTRAEEVDHIIPLTQGGDQYDPTNLQSLCKHHHSQKTRNERHSSNKT